MKGGLLELWASSLDWERVRRLETEMPFCSQRVPETLPYPDRCLSFCAN